MRSHEPRLHIADTMLKHCATAYCGSPCTAPAQTQRACPWWFYAFIAFCLLCATVSAHAENTPSNEKNDLAYRAALGRSDDIRLLIRQGASPNSTNAEGIPVLLIAAARKDAEALNAVQALLENGANVNAKDTQGQTALYYAARAGKTDIVDYLLKNKIDYYSLDKNGDIARTIAFHAGHTDIVKIMDDYVKGQTLQAQNTYQNATQLLKMQQEKEARDIARKAAAERKRQALIAEKQRLEEIRKLKEYQENTQKLSGKVEAISYHACAFQYWSFCRDANQTTDLSDEELDELIENHRQTVQQESMDVMKMFEVGQNYVNKIINPSKSLIFQQLDSMPSRTYRKENGIGTLKDVDKRCNKIAKNWGVFPANSQPPAAARKPAPRKKAPAVTYPNRVQIHKLGNASTKQ